MKKVFPLAAILLAVVLMLGSCAYYEEPSGAAVHSSSNGPNYTINYDQKTIRYDGSTYHYTVSRNGKDISYTITYPNGGVYFSNHIGNTVTAGGNEDYDETTYASGETLVGFLASSYTLSVKAPNIGHYIILLLCLGIGAFQTFFPEDAWYLSHALKAWQYESVEPSSDGLRITRIGGIIVMIMGVILFFMNWS